MNEPVKMAISFRQFFLYEFNYQSYPCNIVYNLAISSKILELVEVHRSDIIHSRQEYNIFSFFEICFIFQWANSQIFHQCKHNLILMISLFHQLSNAFTFACYWQAGPTDDDIYLSLPFRCVDIFGLSLAGIQYLSYCAKAFAKRSPPYCLGL